MSRLANISKLLSANVIAQIAGVAIYPILTRLFTPEDFGLQNLFLTVAGILLIIASADLQYAIPLPKSDEKALNVTSLSLSVTFVLVFILLLTVPLSSQIAHYIFSADAMADVWWMMPIYVLIVGCWQTVNYYLSRNGKFGTIGIYQAIQGLSNAAIKLAAGLLQWSGIFLIIGSIVSQFLALISTSVRPLAGLISHLKNTVSRAEMKATLIEYKSFPIYSMTMNLFASLSNGLPIIMLTHFFGLEKVGYLSLALTIGFMPVQMIGNSIYQVLLKEFADVHSKGGNFFADCKRFLIYSSVIIVPICLVGFYVLPDVCGVLFGDKWRETGRLLRLLLPMLAVAFYTLSLICISEVLLRLKGNLIFSIVSFVVKIAALCIGIYRADFVLSIVLFSVASAVVGICQIEWWMAIARKG